MKSTDDRFLSVAERIDALRVVSRTLVIGYYAFFIHAWYYVVTWFMHFDWSKVAEYPEVSLAIAGFPAIVLTVLTGVLSTLTNAYFNTGRKWSDGTTGTAE